MNLVDHFLMQITLRLFRFSDDDSDFTEGNSLLSNLLTNFDLQIATPVLSLPTSDEIVNEKTTVDLDRLR